MADQQQDPVVQGVLASVESSISSRQEASDLLRKVAEAGETGNFPSDVTCEQLGEALYRICINAPEEDRLLALFTGWRAAQCDFHKRCGCKVPTM